MAKLKLIKTDPYANGNTVALKTGETILTRELRLHVPSASDTTVEALQDVSWQKLAFDSYGNSKYYHYLLDVNKVFNPFEVVPLGTDILVPTIENYK